MPPRVLNPTATKLSCSTRELTPGRAPQDPLEHLATFTCYATGQPIYRQRQPVLRWHRILSGAARKCVQMPDGRRHIVEFLFPGDLFGFGKANQHGCSAEAIAVTTKIASYSREGVVKLAETDPSIARQIRETTFDAIHRLQLRLLILGQRTALARVCSFLLEMADRIAANPPGSIILPMSRYDIADYLSLAVESVSRTLTTLQLGGAITIQRRRIVQILDHRVLAQLADEAEGRQHPFSSHLAAMHQTGIPGQRVSCGDRSPPDPIDVH